MDQLKNFEIKFQGGTHIAERGKGVGIGRLENAK